MERTPEEKELIRLQSKITRRFQRGCVDYGLIEEGDHILIGLSGGKDSLALVEFLGRRAQIYVPHFHVTAVHVRVKERPYISDLSYLQSFCSEWKVPLVIKDTMIGEERPNERGGSDPCFLCSWYRRKALFDLAQELGCNKIALGHHKDDIAETLLMNLMFQGSFSTIPPKLQMERMPIQMVRPFCLVEEKDLIRYAELRGYKKQKQLCPFEKESNRAVVKGILTQMKELNPNVLDSIWGAMENIKHDYLPNQKPLKND